MNLMWRNKCLKFHDIPIFTKFQNRVMFWQDNYGKLMDETGHLLHP